MSCKPLITYYGGKQRMSNKILDLFVPHKLYCEPFAGGLAVLFSKYPSKIEVFNDNSKDLVNLYRVVRDSKLSIKLIEMLDNTLYSREDHKLANKILKDDDEKYKDPILRAWAYFFVINSSFSASIGTGFSVALERNKAQIFNKKCSLIKSISKRLKNVVIECGDAIEIIKKYDSKDSLFYVDPPYPGSHQGHYGGYTIEDFLKLCEVLSTIKGKFILSNYEQDIPDYGWKKTYVQTSVNVKSNENHYKEERVEVLWCNY